MESALKNKLGPHIKFIGIYTSDHLPFISYNTKPIVLIANTLKSSANINTVGHWVGFDFEIYPKKQVIFFDSYGFSQHFYVNSGFSAFLRRYRQTPIYNFGRQFQPDSSMKCGLYVSPFAHYISLYGVNKFTSYIYNRFHIKKKDLAYNDKYVTRYYFKYLSKPPCSHWKIRNKRTITYKECISYKGMYY